MCTDKKTTYLLSGGTAAPIRHLLRVHKIEPCIPVGAGTSRRRAHGHAKHNSESSITLSAQANASLYKGEMHHPHSMMNHLLMGMPMGLPMPIPQHHMDMEDPNQAFVFPNHNGYSVPPTPMSDFAPFAFPMPNMPMPMPNMIPMPMANDYIVTPVQTPSISTLSDESESGLDSSPKAFRGVLSDGLSPESVDSSATLTPVSSENSTTTMVAPTVMPTPASASPSPSPPINVDLAVKSLLEMVLQYDIPPNLIESASFKNFCVSLNPRSTETLPTLKSMLSSSSAMSTVTTAASMAGAFGNYTYSSQTNSNNTPPTSDSSAPGSTQFTAAGVSGSSSSSWMQGHMEAGSNSGIMTETIAVDSFSGDLFW